MNKSDLLRLNIDSANVSPFVPLLVVVPTVTPFLPTAMFLLGATLLVSITVVPLSEEERVHEP